jgi:hypothetical protein
MRAGDRARAIAIVVVAALAAFAGAAQSHPAAAAHPAPQQTAKCPRGDEAAGVCLAPRASCVVHEAKLYAQRGLVCMRGRLKKGGLAVQREGGAFAVEPDGHVSLAEAEQAFIAAFDPLPGVKPIPGAVKLPPHADVTGPLLWIEQDLPHLTPAQRKVVEKVLDPAPARPGAARASKVADPLLAELVPTISAKISNLTGVTLPKHTTVAPATAGELGKNQYTGGGNGGDALPLVDGAGQVTGCRVRILKAELADHGVATNVVAHELTHCAQFAEAGTAARINALPVYFVEGFAEWAGDQVELELDGIDAPDSSAFGWINNPFRSLLARDYDAFPMYDEVAEELGGSGYLWAHFQPLVTADSATGIYEYLASIAAPDFQRNLATNSLLDAGLGTQWNVTGVGLGGLASPDLRETSVADGTSTTLAAPSFAADRAAVDLEADIVTISGKAPGGIRLSDGRTLDPEPTRLCDLADGCTCPDGSSPVDEGGQSGPAIAAIWGGPGGAKVTISGESLEEACGEKPGPGAPPSPGGGSGGRVRFENAQGQTLATFEAAADCSLTGGTLFAKLANRAGGQPLTITLPGFKPGHRIRLAQFTDPASGGPVARYLPYTTDAPVIGGEGEPANAGDWSYDGGTRFGLAAILFLPGTNTGGFADGSFSCASLAAGSSGA